MHRFSPLRPAVLRATLAAAVSAGLLWTFGAPPAVAGPSDPIQIDVTDPRGDVRYSAEPGIDILGFSITQDRAAKLVRGTVTLDADVAAPSVFHLRIGLGLETGAGLCNISKGYGWIHIRHDMGTDLADYAVATNTDVRQDVKVVRGPAPGVVAFETPAAPGAFERGFRCITVQTEEILAGGVTTGDKPFDTATGFAPAEIFATPAPPTVALPPAGQPPVVLDGDGDGVRDAVDGCPTKPGAGTDGCELVPLARSVKLGTKRVVVNRLLATTGNGCPDVVKVIVTLGKKSLARQKLGTLPKGKFCQVQGIVVLKKRVAKARVKIAGAGVVPVAVSVKK